MIKILEDKKLQKNIKDIIFILAVIFLLPMIISDIFGPILGLLVLIVLIVGTIITLIRYKFKKNKSWGQEVKKTLIIKVSSWFFLYAKCLVECLVNPN